MELGVLSSEFWSECKISKLHKKINNMHGTYF